MKKDPGYFEGHSPSLIYIAKRLSDAQRLESIFDGAGIDYGVEADEYYGGIIFRRLRAGAFFYVLPAFRERASEVMRAHRFVPAVDGREPETTGDETLNRP